MTVRRFACGDTAVELLVQRFYLPKPSCNCIVGQSSHLPLYLTRRRWMYQHHTACRIAVRRHQVTTGNNGRHALQYLRGDIMTTGRQGNRSTFPLHFSYLLSLLLPTELLLAVMMDCLLFAGVRCRFFLR